MNCNYMDYGLIAIIVLPFIACIIFKSGTGKNSVPGDNDP
jgi:hypothetical protein